MTFEQRKPLILSSWVAVVAIVGGILTVERPTLWIFVASLALIPPAVATWFWNSPQLTMSQIIGKSRK